jgi:hypothetical protein
MMTLIQTSAAPANATAATAFSRCGRFERQGKGPEYRKENGEFGPLAGLAADLDPPAMIGDNTVNDGKSEASTLADIFRREEGLENPILCFGIHAAAGIGNPEAKEIAPAVRTLRRPRYANGDRPHIADDGLTSVGGQIDNDLLKLTDIGKDERDVFDLFFDLNRCGHRRAQHLQG